ncbi:MAG TPA: glycosyltransferase family 39 protein, partial [Anaerolineae bacterium]
MELKYQMMTSKALHHAFEIARVAGIKIILGVFVALAVIYSVATPAFETPDEMAHFAYIRGLVDGRGFPTAPIVVADDQPAQESSQPPLYYVSAALAVRLIAPDTGDLAEWSVRNPAFPYIFGSTYNDNKNIVLHSLPEVFPYSGAARALHVARLVTVLFGALAVWATYRMGCEAFPRNLAVGLMAAAVVAFTPQFVFISGAASNDPAAVAMCALSLWAVVRVMHHGFTWRRAVALGIGLSLAALSKASAVALAPLAIVALIAVSADRQSAIKRRIRWALLVLAIVFLLAGVWYLRTWIMFGDPLGTSPHMAMPWARPEPLSIGQAVSLLPGTLTSFWLAFGWGNIVAPDWAYSILNLLAAIGLAGALLWFLKPGQDEVAADQVSTIKIDRAIVLLFFAYGA